MTTSTRRRALVLGDESARHPFLRSLPPHVRSAIGEGPAEARTDAGPFWRRAITAGDWRDFFMAYCAAFVAVSLFIS
jgi:hypothetical protein